MEGGEKMVCLERLDEVHKAEPISSEDEELKRIFLEVSKIPFGDILVRTLLAEADLDTIGIRQEPKKNGVVADVKKDGVSAFLRLNHWPGDNGTTLEIYEIQGEEDCLEIMSISAGEQEYAGTTKTYGIRVSQIKSGIPLPSKLGEWACRVQHDLAQYTSRLYSYDQPTFHYRADPKPGPAKIL